MTKFAVAKMMSGTVFVTLKWKISADFLQTSQ